MNAIQKNAPLFFLAALFVPIIIYAASTHLATKETVINNEWLNTARYINIFISIFYFLFIFKFEQIVYKKAQKKENKKIQNPRAVSYIVGIAIIESISINTLGFQTFKLATTTDVLIFSALSIIGILFWTWRYSNVILTTMRQSANKDKILSIISMNNNIYIPGKDYIRAYTIILKLSGILSFILLIIQIKSFLNSHNNIDTNSHFNILPIAFHIFNTVGCFTAAALRIRKSIYAIFATNAISGFLLFWFPLGTAAFIYWYFKVRKREEVK